MADPFDYLGSRDDADGLISDFGQPIALRRTTSSGTSFDPTQTTTDYPTLAAVVDYTIQERKDSTILVGDQRALVAAGPLTALGVTLGGTDALVIGGVAVSIVLAKPLNPAGVIVMYDCQIRA